MSYQPIPNGGQYAQPLVVAVIPAQMVGPSFGLTSTPNPGWDCCNLPPCVCCGRPVYFSDNHKTWGETGAMTIPCCGCTEWNINNARVNPGGLAYDYSYQRGCCSSDGALIVRRGGMEVGRLMTHSFCCPCDKTVINAVDTTGKSLHTLRTPPFSCCGEGCLGPCGGCGPCCTKRPCCETWGRYDTLFLSGPEGFPMDPKTVRATFQYNACCRPYYPTWYGYDSPPAVSEDERALLLGFLFLNLLYPHQFNFQMAYTSPLPPTLGRLQ
jgi:hypothetical protein